MAMLVILGILMILLSQMGSSSSGFLLTGIVTTLVGVGLIVLTVVGGRRQRR
ncbi:hypothetical protein [Streptomyces sp. NBC_00236]|uniref:hypothetical protein n=1 Tax=unclassified Streptomyces TaxID=2593676 RepID=UPI002E2BCAC1|nr:hypothetical protein [Streptomyces sp. NBC_00236]